jgi:hypothetical protein
MKTDGSEREVVRELLHEKRQRESSERTARDLSGISVERICGKTGRANFLENRRRAS